MAELRPSVTGWYGPTAPGSDVWVEDGSRPRRLARDKKPLIMAATREELPEVWWILMAQCLGVTPETMTCLFNEQAFLRHWKREEEPMEITARTFAFSEPVRGIPVVFLGKLLGNAFKSSKGEDPESPAQFFAWWNLETGAPAVVIPEPVDPIFSEHRVREAVAVTLEKTLLYHGKCFRIGDYPHGAGSRVEVIEGQVWGDAKRRLKHKAKR